MGALDSLKLHITKMAFTDLIPALFGSTGTNASVLENATKFLKNNNPMSSQISSFQSFQDAFQNVDFLIGTVRNPVVQLFLNPETITVKKSVLLDKKQTRGGFVVQFWGHDLETIEVKAATAYFEISKNPLAAFELLKRQCYQGRFHTSQPFRGSPIIGMVYESQALKGYFNNFDFTISADKPFKIEYSFTFTVTENVAFLVGNNITNLVAQVTGIGGQFNVNKNRSDVSVVPESYQMGKGWGVQLF